MDSPHRFRRNAKESAPDFQTLYGKKKLSTIIKQYPSNFETRLRDPGKSEIIELRLLKPPR